jgi:aspartyl-tRNA synthetase
MEPRRMEEWLPDIDRVVMILANEPNIREVIPFQKQVTLET